MRSYKNVLYETDDKLQNKAVSERVGVADISILPLLPVQVDGLLAAGLTAILIAVADNWL